MTVTSHASGWDPTSRGAAPGLGAFSDPTTVAACLFATAAPHARLRHRPCCWVEARLSRHHESAGEQKSGRARKGNFHLRTLLVGAAISAPRTKGSYLKDKLHRLMGRRGAMWAALAIAPRILVAAHHMLAKGIGYHDLGETYLDQIGQTRTVASLKRRLERLGDHVTLQPKAEAAV